MGFLFPCSCLLWDLGQITQQVSRFFLCKMRDKNHMLSVQDSREGELTFFLLFCLLHDFKRETAKTSCYFYLSHGRHNIHLSIFPNWMRQQNIAWRIKHSYTYYILCEMTGYFGNWMGWKKKGTMSPYFSQHDFKLFWSDWTTDLPSIFPKMEKERKWIGTQE